MATEHDADVRSIGRFDPYTDTRALERMARYDELRDRGDALFSEEFEGFWILTRADLVREAMQNPRLFSSTATLPSDPNPAFQWVPLMLDPPVHTQWRQLLGPHFAPAAVARLEPKVRGRCAELIDDLLGRGECDFVAAFAREYPTTIFMGLMGLPLADAAQFMAWEDAILNYSTESDPDRSTMMQAMTDVREYFRTLLALRRREPADDLVTATLSFELDGRPVDEEDLLNLCLLLFMAGLDTVTQQLTYSFLHLATNPADRHRVAGQPDIIPEAIEELMRYYSTVTAGRRVMADTEFHGCPFKEGQIVFMPLTAATRDPAEFADADRVDFDRPDNRHMAFGAGAHRCLGSHLARRELRIAFEEWHARIPEYRLAPGFDPSEIVEHSGGGVMGLDRLPLVWDPGR